MFGNKFQFRICVIRGCTICVTLVLVFDACFLASGTDILIKSTTRSVVMQQQCLKFFSTVCQDVPVLLMYLNQS
ncbi:hypothetical protein DOY81_010161 [Sarcophaga bullata]|nr:hypothetical protein DOY81_010161 [Sarcophaga bullata]